MRDERLRMALGYRKFAGPVRLLVLDTGYLVVNDLVDGAEDLGWSVAKVPMKSKGAAQNDSLAALLKAFVQHRPDFILTVNHLGFDADGVLVGVLKEYGIPVASWFVDHPLPILGGARKNAADNVQIFCFERTAIDWLTAEGYRDPVYLPTGANRRYFHPDNIDQALKAKLAHPLTFAGNSWWTKARVEPEKTVIKAARKLAKKRQIDRRIMTGGFEQLLQKTLPGNPRRQSAAAQVMLAEASLKRRQAFAKALMAAGIRIHGDPYWQEMVPGIQLAPFVDNQKGLPALFAASDINANVTAVQMPTAVNQRVWDVPAAGGFLLTDDQEDAKVHFEEDREVVLYDSFEMAVDKAKYYLAHETERNAISGRAFEKVEKAHSLTQRMGVVGERMRRRFG